MNVLLSSFHPRWSETLGFSSVLLKQEAGELGDCSIKSERSGGFSSRECPLIRGCELLTYMDASWQILYHKRCFFFDSSLFWCFG